MKAHPHAPARSLAADLSARQDKLGRPINIGLVGCGEMGTDIVTQVLHMPGLKVAAIAERRPPQAKNAYAIAGLDFAETVTTAAQSKFDEAIASGKVGVTEDSDLIVKSPHIDVVIDATGKPAVGAEMGLAAMEQGKHLVMMNVEADVTIGAYLKREAKRLGVCYSLGAGDEPSSCMELINFVTGLGYPIVAAGKGKNNPLNIDATPDALCRGSPAPQHECAHAGGIRRWLQDHGGNGGHFQCHGLGAGCAGHARARGLIG